MLWRIPVVTALAAFVAVSCDQAPMAVEEGTTDSPALDIVNGGANGPSASGHINLTFEGALETVSFHARQTKDGSIQGSFEARARAEGFELGMHGVLDCLHVDGNVAVVSGHVTNGKWGFGTVGQAWVWAVRDNGQGKGVDEWTDVLFAGFEPVPGLCEEFPADFLFGIQTFSSEGGNVQVRP